MSTLAIWHDGPLSLPDSDTKAVDWLAELVRQLSAVGWQLVDYATLSQSRRTVDAILCLNLPNSPLPEMALPAGERPTLYAFLMECEVIMPHNWEVARHEPFDAIFTWREDLADGKRYIWHNFAQPLTPLFTPEEHNPSKLCTLVAGNKLSYHPFELYSRRVEAIRWFEQHQPEVFDLYGVGWDKPRVRYPKPLRWLRKIKPINRLIYRTYPSYRGIIADKLALLAHYKFAICYENAQQIPDYITEKIFDCLVAGCIPIYWGAPNISRRVPADCFIDARDFGGYPDIYGFISTMDAVSYRQYLHSISDFLQSEYASPYRAAHAAGVITRRVSHHHSD